MATEAVDKDKEALKEMMRQVREGFGEARAGGGRNTVARGSMSLNKLTAADRSSRREARRLGLLNADELDSEGEDGTCNMRHASNVSCHGCIHDCLRDIMCAVHGCMWF